MTLLEVQNFHSDVFNFQIEEALLWAFDFKQKQRVGTFSIQVDKAVVSSKFRAHSDCCIICALVDINIWVGAVLQRSGLDDQVVR